MLDCGSNLGNSAFNYDMNEHWHCTKKGVLAIFLSECANMRFLHQFQEFAMPARGNDRFVETLCGIRVLDVHSSGWEPMRYKNLHAC